MSKSPFFWVDAQQARDRLSGTYIRHKDDVVLVEEINISPDGVTPLATVNRFPTGVREDIRLDDPGFFRFRKLPPMGWVNTLTAKAALFLERRPVRRTSHGLNDNNVAVGQTSPGGIVTFRDYRYRHVAPDPGYREAMVSNFPTLDEALSVVREDSTIAISLLYAIYRDPSGVRWLLRRTQKVGLFPNNDTIVLLGKNSYLREELVESPQITVKNIQSF